MCVSGPSAEHTDRWMCERSDLRYLIRDDPRLHLYMWNLENYGVSDMTMLLQEHRINSVENYIGNKLLWLSGLHTQLCDSYPIIPLFG